MIIFLTIILSLIFFLLFLFYLGFLNAALYLAIFIILIILIVLPFFFLEVYRVIFKANAPYLCTSRKLIKRILKEIDFKEKAVVYDLGCGDGRFLRELIKNKDINVIGFEYFIIPYLLAKFYNFFAKKKIRIKYQDFFKADLSKADYIFCFLITEEMVALAKKLKKEAKPGAIIISNTFKFVNWQPEQIIILDKKKKGSLNNKIYIYKR